MKIFHLADLHFGKTVHDVQMVDADQPAWVEELFKLADERQPDAIVIAGDVYDTKYPSEEAVKLLNKLVTGLANRKKQVFIVPGNHDSNIRLAFGNELLKNSSIYICGEVTKKLACIPLTVAGVKVNFWLLPYIYPTLVESKEVLDRDDLKTYDMAMRALLEQQDINKEEINLLVAHQNVLANGKKPEHSASEAIVGGLGEIDYSAFADFDYVALGHIHNAQSMGRETVRYAGCPLFYDFSECGRWKGVTEVNILGKNAITVDKLEIPLLHKMVRLTGTVQEIVEQAKQFEELDKYYVQAVITEHNFSPDDYNRMKYYLGSSLMNIDYQNKENSASLAGKAEAELTGAEKMNLEDNLVEFLEATEGFVMNEEQGDLVKMLIEQQSHASNTNLKDYKNVPKADVEELYAFLMEESK